MLSQASGSQPEGHGILSGGGGGGARNNLKTEFKLY